jgi:hypothetical protein
VNIFPLRRREVALSALKLPEAAFTAVDLPATEMLPAGEPEEAAPMSPANELVAVLLELDISEAVRADNPPSARPAEPPAPLTRRHLETIDRLVAHLKADEDRLRQQISDARKQLADTQLARHGFERNGAYLRRGVTVLVRRSEAKATPPRQSALASPRKRRRPAAAASGIGDVPVIAAMTNGDRREMH